jgi:hypothetical protein
MLVVWWTVSPHYHIEDFSTGTHIVHIRTGGTAIGVYGDIGDVVAHCSLGAESYYVLRHTFHFFTLGTSPASIDPAHFRRATYPEPLILLGI